MPLVLVMMADNNLSIPMQIIRCFSPTLQIMMCLPTTVPLSPTTSKNSISTYLPAQKNEGGLASDATTAATNDAPADYMQLSFNPSAYRMRGNLYHPTNGKNVGISIGKTNTNMHPMFKKGGKETQRMQ